MIKRDVLIILWMTFITVAAWIGFNIYHIAVTSTISKELNQQIVPIEANFDMDTINKLNEREKIKPLYQLSEKQPENSASASASNAPQASPASPSSGVISVTSVTPTIAIKGQP